MIKLFGYECKRLIWNKFFLGLLIITGFYSYQILTGDIILGIGCTAPFSKWSYGYYLTSVLPLLLIALLFFITFLFSAKEKRVSQITSATPISPIKYGSVRYLAILAGFCIIASLVIGISFAFYKRIFLFDYFNDFMEPFLWAVIPAFLLFMGLGVLLGNIHVGFVYGIMLLTFATDFLGSRFFSEYPMTLPIGTNGEPAFLIPAVIQISKIIFSLIGVICTCIGLTFYHRQKRQ